jgi:hypothetical protein
MTPEEFSNQFDVLYNNITSNQAPGLTEYEKSVFLTKAQNEKVKNFFTSASPGNVINQGFDDSALRQADFSCLMKTATGDKVSSSVPPKIDSRSTVFTFPPDVFIVINESVRIGDSTKNYQVLPLRYDEYTRLMSKPFQRPCKNQVWRLINSGTGEGNTSTKYVELIGAPGTDDSTTFTYTVRYIRKPKPIIVGDLDDLTIDGYKYGETGLNTTAPTSGTIDIGTGTQVGSSSTTTTQTTSGCELDPVIHEEILQRAVELAKVSWTATGQDNMQPVLQTGQRSE